MVAGRFNGEAIVTPCSTTVCPGSVSSQLPPVFPARSTTTLPGFMPSTASAVTNRGAGRPGTNAVVITTSNPVIAFSSAFCCCARSSWRARGHNRPHRRRRCRRPATGHPPTGPDRPPPDARHSRWSDRPGAWRWPAPEARPRPPRTPAPGRLHRSRRGGQHREEPGRLRRRHQHRLVPGDIGLRRQRIHRLRPRNPRNRLHGEAGDARQAQAFGDLGMCARCQEPDHGGFWLQQTDLIGGRRVHLHHEVRRPGVTDGGSGLFVLFVRDQCPCASSGFDDDGDAGGLRVVRRPWGQARHGVRLQRSLAALR